MASTPPMQVSDLVVGQTVTFRTLLRVYRSYVVLEKHTHDFVVGYPLQATPTREVVQNTAVLPNTLVLEDEN